MVLGVLLSPGLVNAQSRFFAGGVGGVATLSADAQTSITSASASVSTYRPFNGPALNIFAGTHVNDYLSLQVNYIWNSNDLAVTSTLASTSSLIGYEEKRASSQHSGIFDVLIYFRNRNSGVRPYLSGGSGVVRFKSSRQELVNMQGSPALFPVEFTSSELALRAAVGIDFAVGRQFAIRYSFSETIRRNPVSSRLSPPGERNLANFQNLVGIVKYF